MGPNPTPRLSVAGGGDHVTGVNVPPMRDLRPGAGFPPVVGGVASSTREASRFQQHYELRVGESSEVNLGSHSRDVGSGRVDQFSGDRRRNGSESSELGEGGQGQGAGGQGRRRPRLAHDMDGHTASAQGGRHNARHTSARYPRNPFIN